MYSLSWKCIHKVTMSIKLEIQSIFVAFEHCVLRDHVRQELSVGGASRK